MFGIMKECNKKCPYCLLTKNEGAGMDVIKNFPVIEDENIGISQTLQERKKMGYPKICAMRLGTQCNKKCARRGEEKTEIGVSQNVSPP